MAKAFPYIGAIFDLDGTVLDSLWVWHRVDERFFGARGLKVPEDYGRAVAGMSFTETAAYTIGRFALNESVRAVEAEWLALAAEEYAREVGPVPGIRQFLRRLKRAGVKLAAATANRPSLIEPALERLGLLELFDAVLTAGELGDKNKSDGALFVAASERLGVAPSDCIVFEDTLSGIRGARAAGMGACAVESPACAHALEEIAPLADGVLADFTGADRLWALPERPGRCVIFTARCEGDPGKAYRPAAGDLVICADSGWRVARRAGIAPDLVMGDFDSSEAPLEGRVERYPVEKDDTDTMLCVKRGLALGYDDFLLVGGFGGRLDHTLANLQALHYIARRGARAQMRDGVSWATVLVDGGSVRVPCTQDKLSVFSLGDACRGVTIRGAKYNIENATFTNAFPLGAANNVAAGAAEISLREGALLVITCPDA